MRITLKFILIASFLLVSPSTLVAQRSNNAAQTADELRFQLGDVIAKQTELQTRAEELDEALKPENIDRYSQYGGSTRPEEVREDRRRQLTNEKAGVTAQLDLLTTSRGRLEAAILAADSLAYQQAAQGPAETQVDAMWGQQFLTVPSWQKGVVVGLVAIVGIGGVIALVRRRKHLKQK